MCKPDKGKSVVILQRDDYIRKVELILTEGNAFKMEKVDDPFKHTLLTEDKINRFLKTLLNKKLISDTEYRFMYAVGYKPGLSYGLPKIHKEGCRIRQVLSAIKTPGYKI